MAYKPKAVRGLGWAMVVLGSLSVTLGVAADIHFSALGVRAVEHFISAPVWSGLLVLTTGILGIFSAKKPTNKCLIVAFMVVAIFVILTCACCIGFAALGIWLGIWLDYRMCAQFDYGAYYAAVERHENNPTQYEDPDFWKFKTYDCSASTIGLHAANIVLAVIEIMLGFAVSIMSCVGLCTMRRAAGQVSRVANRRCSWPRIQVRQAHLSSCTTRPRCHLPTRWIQVQRQVCRKRRRARYLLIPCEKENNTKWRPPGLHDVIKYQDIERWRRPGLLDKGFYIDFKRVKTSLILRKELI
uniref:Uncharacterized protein n=1 Tax=Branchiostoma floridae TaxID=7739 RepID=C3YHT8_BRAFL|eukprot:XP_002604064.1 hypothetical protein BRAFLDRAFT_71646 [Branchiostoma floridae]